MIPRYSRACMREIWSDLAKYKIWLDIEVHACAAQAELGVIPKSAAMAVRSKGQFDIDRIADIEAECKHDVIAFLTNLAESIGSSARFVHQGMTSSDVLDTTLGVQLVRATDILLGDLESLLSALRRRAEEYKMTLMIGRSHGVHAEPMTFGLKLASHYAEFSRNYSRLQAARSEIAVCAISGAVGSFANIDPFVESYVAEKLGLEVELVSTQVIARDRHAMFFSVLGVIAGGIERLATTIRLMQSSEVGEAEEAFSAKQKGSSAMPHKRNPVLSENLTGLARLVRSSVVPALENIALWHERDISHSSVERIMAPDTTVLLDFALSRLVSVVDGLVVYPSVMESNLGHFGGLYNSQRILLALTQAGVSREQAYIWVQRNAMQAWRHSRDARKLHSDGYFQQLLCDDSDIMSYLSAEDITAAFDMAYHTKHIDTIFARVFGDS